MGSRGTVGGGGGVAMSAANSSATVSSGGPSPVNPLAVVRNVQNYSDKENAAKQNVASLKQSNPEMVPAYQRQVQNYHDLVAAKKFEPGKDSYTGLDAAIAMDSVRMGTTVKIEGGDYAGTYKLLNNWVPQFPGGYVFPTGIDSTTALCSQYGNDSIDGVFRIKENKNVKITFIN